MLPLMGDLTLRNHATCGAPSELMNCASNFHSSYMVRRRLFGCARHRQLYAVFVVCAEKQKLEKIMLFGRDGQLALSSDVDILVLSLPHVIVDAIKTEKSLIIWYIGMHDDIQHLIKILYMGSFRRLS